MLLGIGYVEVIPFQLNKSIEKQLNQFPLLITKIYINSFPNSDLPRIKAALSLLSMVR
jgi:hypothetical protein